MDRANGDIHRASIRMYVVGTAKSATTARIETDLAICRSEWDVAVSDIFCSLLSTLDRRTASHRTLSNHTKSMK